MADIPDHLAKFDWYAPHQAWLHANGYWTRHKVTGVEPKRADLRNADLRGAILSGAILRNADLRNADLSDADLRNADLRNADLSDAVLRNADLRHAVLRGADLRHAVLRNADLRHAVLRGAVLRDGETWEKYESETVPALCAAGGVPLEDVLTEEHWGCHSWTNCPMAAAFKCNDLGGVPLLYRPRAEEFVRFFDAGLLPLDKVREAAGLPPLKAAPQ